MTPKIALRVVCCIGKLISQKYYITHQDLIWYSPLSYAHTTPLAWTWPDTLLHIFCGSVCTIVWMFSVHIEHVVCVVLITIGMNDGEAPTWVVSECEAVTIIQFYCKTHSTKFNTGKLTMVPFLQKSKPEVSTWNITSSPKTAARYKTSLINNLQRLVPNSWAKNIKKVNKNGNYKC